MVRAICLILVLAVLVLACQNTNTAVSGESDETHLVETIVGKRKITDELAGVAFRHRATEYFLIQNGDTSDFSIYLSEHKENNRVTLEFPQSHLLAQQVSYRQRISELSPLLLEAKKDYHLDSLHGISLNTLITQGDLAITVTEELLRAFPEYATNPAIRNEDYSRIFMFLMDSRLTSDINELFAPFDLKVERVWGEKLHFTDRASLYLYSEVETDSLQTPNNIFNGMIGVFLQKKH